MPEAFKHLLNPALVRACALHLRRAWPEFDAMRFESLVAPGYAELEMKARAMRVADALGATLPTDFDHACAVIEAALGPAGAGDDLSSLRSSDAGLAGWIVWPLGEFVARRGLAHPHRALAALHALTQRFSAEWAIRPLLLAHPQLCYTTLAGWALDPSAHVRRLVSEGSRPRLPWGLQLKPAIADPRPALPLLKLLQDDASAYVRRSVANHLNDIGKDHPDLLAQWLETHLPGANPERQQLLRHASRSLIKAGDARVLAAFGVARGFEGSTRLALECAAVPIGGTLPFTLELCAPDNAPPLQKLVIDYAVHHVKANGEHSPKVFKGWQLDLDAGRTRLLRKSHSFRLITTRVYYPGCHRLDVRINGEVVAEAAFELVR